MKALQAKRFFSSFWFWFVGALIVNQLVLMLVVLLVLIRPSATTFAQLHTSMVTAYQQIEQQEGRTGVETLRQKLGNLDSYEVLQGVPDRSGAMYQRFSPGVSYVIDGIEKASQGRLTASFAYDDGPTFSVWDRSRPDEVFRFRMGSKMFAAQFLFWAMLMVTLVSIFAAFWIAKRLTRPLADLSAQAMSLASGKALQQIEVDPYSSPEIQALSKTMNAMRAAQDQLILDREQLLASVTHDLRTPLSRLGVALEMIEAKAPSEVAAMFGDIEEIRLILDQFVELGKLNQEADEAWQAGDLNGFLREIQQKYQRAGVQIVADYATVPLVIRYKLVALTRLVYNLIDNACRHGTGGVRLVSRMEQSHVVLEIANPINSTNESGRDTLALAPEGNDDPAGLGLRIVRQFAKVHDADFTVHSAQGVRFAQVTFKRFSGNEAVS